MERLATMARIPDWGERSAMLRQVVLVTGIVEAEAARHPDATAGRAALDARLERRPPAERAAFDRSIRL